MYFPSDSWNKFIVTVTKDDILDGLEVMAKRSNFEVIKGGSSLLKKGSSKPKLTVIQGIK